MRFPPAHDPNVTNASREELVRMAYATPDASPLTRALAAALDDVNATLARLRAGLPPAAPQA